VTVSDLPESGLHDLAFLIVARQSADGNGHRMGPVLEANLPGHALRPHDTRQGALGIAVCELGGCDAVLAVTDGKYDASRSTAARTTHPHRRLHLRRM
jgi:hypothetical protein